MTPAERARLIDQEEFRRESQRLLVAALNYADQLRAEEEARFFNIRYPNGKKLSLKKPTTRSRSMQPDNTAAQYTAYGETRSIREWAEYLDVSEAEIWRKMKDAKSFEHTIDCICEGLRTAPIYECNGKRLTLREWAKELGLSLGTVTRRLELYPIDIALQPKHKSVTIDGLTLTIPQWAEKAGITAGSISKRIREGMTPEQAVRFYLNKETRQPKPPKAPKAPKAPKPPKPARVPKVIEIDGISWTIAEWADEAGVSFSAIYSSIYKGMTPKEAVRFYLDRNCRADWQPLCVPCSNSIKQRQEGAAC